MTPIDWAAGLLTMMLAVRSARLNQGAVTMDPVYGAVRNTRWSSTLWCWAAWIWIVLGVVMSPMAPDSAVSWTIGAILLWILGIFA